MNLIISLSLFWALLIAGPVAWAVGNEAADTEGEATMESAEAKAASTSALATTESKAAFLLQMEIEFAEINDAYAKLRRLMDNRYDDASVTQREQWIQTLHQLEAQRDRMWEAIDRVETADSAHFKDQRSAIESDWQQWKQSVNSTLSSKATTVEQITDHEND